MTALEEKTTLELLENLQHSIMNESRFGNYFAVLSILIEREKQRQQEARKVHERLYKALYDMYELHCHSYWIVPDDKYRIITNASGALAAARQKGANQ